MRTDYAAEAARHRNVAEEFRTLAACTARNRLRDAYQRLADDYDVLAEIEDRVARDLKFAN
jgi:hypothetical protein